MTAKLLISILVLILTSVHTGHGAFDVQVSQEVSGDRKREFLELLKSLPFKGEFYTREAGRKAAPYLPVLFSLTEQDTEKYDLYAVVAISVAISQDKERRAYAVAHFGEIRHPKLKHEVAWIDLCAIIREPRLIALELERAWGGRWLPEELTARREGLRKARVGLGQQVERLTEAYLGGVLDLGGDERRRREIEARTEAFASQERELAQHVIGFNGIDCCNRIVSYRLSGRSREAEG